ncbi:ribonuclease T2 family protein [Azospirillum sp. sgz302134]
MKKFAKKFALAGAAVALALALTATAAEARRGSNDQPSRGKTGEFDYYLLSLSWSPDYCKSHKDDTAQCGPDKHNGFVVHGLWPQYDTGYPQYCIKPAPAVPQEAVDIAVQGNPSAALFTDHEWPKHGTCATTEPVAYAKNEIKAFQAVNVPDRLKARNTLAQISLKDFKAILLQANPQLSDASLKVQCDRGGALQEIQICLDKTTLNPRACTAFVKDKCPTDFTIDPIP